MITIDRNGSKYLTFSEEDGIELSSRNVTDLISECLPAGIMSVMVEETYLSEEFFRLESLEAGEILQKFRTYGIRLAIIVSPGRLRAGRFREMVAEESKGRWFSAFTERRKAEEWLLNG